jgi:nitrogen regulatory protein P-II 1
LKKIEAVIRAEKFGLVDAALRKIGIGGLTFSEMKGRGRSRGTKMVLARGTGSYRPDYTPRIKIEIVLKDSDLERVIEAIIGGATTESIGDGKIFVSTIDEAIDIGSNDKGEKAV